MRKLFLLILLISTSIFSQEIIDLDKQMKFDSTGGGNGGHPIEDRIVDVMGQISDFFIEVENQEEFPEVDFELLLETVPQVGVFAGNFLLTDKYGTRRCLLNKDKKIYINEKCWKDFLSREQDHYSIIFHELLGMIGVETAGKYVPSKYPVSSRLEKYVQRLNAYGLVNVNKLKEVNGLGLSCGPFGKTRRDEYTRTLFLMKLNKDRTLNVYVKDIKPKMFNIHWAYTFPTSSGQLMILDSDFRTKSVDVSIDLNGKTEQEGRYNRGTKRLHVPFNMWKSKVSHFEVPLSEILTLDTYNFNKITIERHMKNGTVSALNCQPLIIDDVDRAKKFTFNDSGLYGITAVEEGHLLSIRNYFLNL